MSLSLRPLTGCWNHEPTAKSVLQTNGQICSSAKEKKTGLFCSLWHVWLWSPQVSLTAGGWCPLASHQVAVVEEFITRAAFEVALLSVRKGVRIKRRMGQAHPGARRPRQDLNERILNSSKGHCYKSNMKRELFWHQPFKASLIHFIREEDDNNAERQDRLRSDCQEEGGKWHDTLPKACWRRQQIHPHLYLWSKERFMTLCICSPPSSLHLPAFPHIISPT